MIVGTALLQVSLHSKFTGSWQSQYCSGFRSYKLAGYTVLWVWHWQVTLAVMVSGWAHVLHAVYKPWGPGTTMYQLQHGSLFVTTFVFLMVSWLDGRFQVPSESTGTCPLFLQVLLENVRVGGTGHPIQTDHLHVLVQIGLASELELRDAVLRGLGLDRGYCTKSTEFHWLPRRI